MRYLSLFTDETSWLALEGKVIPAADVASVETAAELAQSMSERLQQANDDIEQRKQTAQASGYEAGYEAGLKAAALHNDQAVNTLQQAYKKQTQEQEAQVVALAMAVVKRIAGEVDSDAWLSAQALQAVASLRNPDESVRLLVHASQVDSVRARINALKETPDPQAIRIDSVEAGEDNDVDQCRLEVAVGSTVLVDLHTQINAIERALNTAYTQAVAHG